MDKDEVVFLKPCGHIKRNGGCFVSSKHRKEMTKNNQTRAGLTEENCQYYGECDLSLNENAEKKTNCNDVVSGHPYYNQKFKRLRLP